MPNAFDEVLDVIKGKDPIDAEKFKEIAEKYPDEVKGGILRQADYSRKMAAVDKDLKALEGWRSWKDQYWDSEHNMTQAEYQNHQTINELNEQLELAKNSNGEIAMTFDDLKSDLDQYMKGQGILTKTDAANFLAKKDILDDKGNPKFVSSDQLNSSFAGVEYLYGTVTPLMFKHKDEFGEVLNPADLIKYANDNGIRDLNKAYETQVSAKRQEIADKKHKDELEAAKQAGLAEGLKTVNMGKDGHMPVDQGSSQMGHLEARIKGTPEELAEFAKIPESAQLGKGQLGRFAAQEFIKDQAAKTAA